MVAIPRTIVVIFVCKGELSDSGEITFRNSETQVVIEKVKEMAAEASQGSFNNVRESDVLTATLGNSQDPG